MGKKNEDKAGKDVADTNPVKEAIRKSVKEDQANIITEELRASNPVKRTLQEAFGDGDDEVGGDKIDAVAGENVVKANDDASNRIVLDQDPDSMKKHELPAAVDDMDFGGQQ